jgi:hypothetical protein
MTMAAGDGAARLTGNPDTGNMPKVWAIRRALDLCGLSHQRDQAERSASASRVLRAFAHYIEQNEEPPVDHLQVEGCELEADKNELAGPERERSPISRAMRGIIMNRKLNVALFGIIIAVLAGAAAPHLRAVFDHENGGALCSEPLPSSLQKVDCDPTALTALVKGTIEPARDNRTRAAVMVIRQADLGPLGETLKHYAIIEVDCSSAGPPDVLLVKTVDKDGTDLQSAEVSQAFLDYWFTPEPARFHLKIHEAVCAKS